DPQVPAALAPAVVGVVSLNDFRPQPQLQIAPNLAFGCNDLPFTSTCNGLVPADLATIYNLNPLYSDGLSGQAQTMVLLEETDVVNPGDWSTFRAAFGFASPSPAGSFTQIHPSCNDPGPVPISELEATIDAEWASATAPSASIVAASCPNTNANFGT